MSQANLSFIMIIIIVLFVELNTSLPPFSLDRESSKKENEQ